MDVADKKNKTSVHKHTTRRGIHKTQINLTWTSRFLFRSYQHIILRKHVMNLLMNITWFRMECSASVCTEPLHGDAGLFPVFASKQTTYHCAWLWFCQGRVTSTNLQPYSHPKGDNALTSSDGNVFCFYYHPWQLLLEWTRSEVKGSATGVDILS